MTAADDEMNEEKWLACTDPLAMLDYLDLKATDRKLRLLAVAWCRRVWHLLLDDRSRQAVETAEDQADGLASGTRVDAACYAGMDALWALEQERASGGDHDLNAVAELMATYCLYPLAACHVLDVPAGYAVHRYCKDRLKELYAVPEVEFPCQPLRDVFGPLPFRAITIAPSCVTAAVLALAQAAYDDRLLPSGILKTDRLAALADAGCDDASVLAHLQSPGPHCRGCWGFDLVLGRA